MTIFFGVFTTLIMAGCVFYDTTIPITLSTYDTLSHASSVKVIRFRPKDFDKCQSETGASRLCDPTKILQELFTSSLRSRSGLGNLEMIPEPMENPKLAAIEAKTGPGLVIVLQNTRQEWWPKEPDEFGPNRLAPFYEARGRLIRFPGETLLWQRVCKTSLSVNYHVTRGLTESEVASRIINGLDRAAEYCGDVLVDDFSQVISDRKSLAH